jgi:four helix bundle protein
MERDLDERLLEYAARVVELAEALPKTMACRHIGSQMLRSGTSVGAHYQEAQAAESREDFVHKLQVALKELRESLYWLRLLARSGSLPAAQLKALLGEAIELRAILSKAVATAKARPKRP